MKKLLMTILACLICLQTFMPCLAFEELSKGSKGDAVVELQNRLNELGYDVGIADGDFGGKTEKTIKQFQEDHGLEATGRVDEATYIALFEASTLMTPDDAFSEICEVLGNPHGVTTRDAMGSTYGSGMIQDQLLVFDFMNGYQLSLLRSDRPDEMVSWSLDPASEEDYKKLFSILHTYGAGYGLSENDRCLYIKYEIGAKTLIPYCYDKQLTPDGTYVLSSIDELIETVIKNLHPQMEQWMESELLRK